MTSLYPTTQSFVLQGPVLMSEKRYTRGNIMYYLFKEYPIFARLVQLAKLDDQLNDALFDGTLFVPCREYLDRYQDYLYSIQDVSVARNVVSASILPNVVQLSVLESAVLPTQNKYNPIYVSQVGGECCINGNLFIVKPNLLLNNGIVHVLNGMVNPRWNV